MLYHTPNGKDQIVRVFGSLDDPRFEARNIVSFQLPYPLLYGATPVTHARAHRLAVDNFIAALTNIAGAGLADQFVEFNGIYASRPIRGFPMYPSCHAWGIAGDFGGSQHALGSNAQWPKAIIQAFQGAGFFWGGNFKERKDPMHFQLATGY